MDMKTDEASSATSKQQKQFVDTTRTRRKTKHENITLQHANVKWTFTDSFTLYY